MRVSMPAAFARRRMMRWASCWKRALVVSWLRDDKERLVFFYRISDQVLERGMLIGVAKNQMLRKRFVLIALSGHEAEQGFTLVLGFGDAFQDVIMRDRGVVVKW